MNGPLDAYFVAEAGEQLDQLEVLLGLDRTPDIDRMLELAGNVRSIAQRAGAATVASVAERLEDAARSILTRSIAWSEDVRVLSQQTVRDLKLLMRAVNRWGPDEERRVREAINRWDEHEAGITDGESESDGIPISTLFFDDAGPHVFPPAQQASPNAPTSASDSEPESSPEQGEGSSEGVEPTAEGIATGDPSVVDDLRADKDLPSGPESEAPIERMGDRFEPVEPVAGVDLDSRTDEPGDMPTDESDEVRGGWGAGGDLPLAAEPVDAPAGGWRADTGAGITVGDSHQEPSAPAEPELSAAAEPESSVGAEPEHPGPADLEPSGPADLESPAPADPEPPAPRSESPSRPVRSLDAARGWANEPRAEPRGEASAPRTTEPRVPPRQPRVSPEAALAEAAALRPLFERHGRGDAIPERPLADLVDELFALLDLARGRTRSE